MARLRSLLAEAEGVLRAWDWAHSRAALFAGAATLFANGTPLSNWMGFDGLISALSYNILQFGFPLVFLLQWAHRVVAQRLLPPALVYALVPLVEVPLGIWVIAPPLAPWLGVAEYWTTYNDWMLLLSTLFWHALAVGALAQRELHRLAEQRREAAAEAHAAQQRALAATQLLALQARVDPPMLFERLQTIDRELAQDPVRANQRLGALIDLLRAQQPHAQAAVSTLERELAALRAYAQLVSEGGETSERLHVVVPAAMQSLPFAPLVLLPLARELLRAPMLWQLVGHNSQRAELQWQALGPDAASCRAALQGLDLPMLRQRLQAVLGAQAQLDLDLQPDLPRLLLQWPAS